MGAHREACSASHPPRRAPPARAQEPPASERASGRAGREEGPEVDRNGRVDLRSAGTDLSRPARPGPSARPWRRRRGAGVRGLWRACNWLRAPSSRWRALCRLAPRAGRERREGEPASPPGRLRCRPTDQRGRRSRPRMGRAELGLMLGEPPPVWAET